MTTRRPSTRAVLLALAAVSLLLAVVLSPYASSSPDGLTYASRLLGFDTTETAHATAGSPLAGYAVRGVETSALATGLSPADHPISVPDRSPFHGHPQRRHPTQPPPKRTCLHRPNLEVPPHLHAHRPTRRR